MAEIGVVHMDLMSKGGGEAVSMNVLEALQDEHDVTLLTLTEPDLDELNAYFNTAVESVTVRQAGRLAPALNDPPTSPLGAAVVPPSRAYRRFLFSTRRRRSS